MPKRASASKPIGSPDRSWQIGWNSMWNWPSASTRPIALGRRVVPAARGLVAREVLGELADDAVGHRGRERRVAVGGAVDRVEQVLGRDALDDVARRAGAEHLDDRRPVLVARRARARARSGTGARISRAASRPAAARHVHVDDADVGRAR